MLEQKISELWIYLQRADRYSIFSSSRCFLLGIKNVTLLKFSIHDRLSLHSEFRLQRSFNECLTENLSTVNLYMSSSLQEFKSFSYVFNTPVHNVWSEKTRTVGLIGWKFLMIYLTLLTQSVKQESLANAKVSARQPYAPLNLAWTSSRSRTVFEIFSHPTIVWHLHSGGTRWISGWNL